MGTRQFKLTQEELREIQGREQATRDARELRCLQAVRLYGSSEAIGSVQRVSGASVRTIQRWVDRYEARGLEGLKTGWKGGNHRGLSEAQRSVVGGRLRELTPSAALGRANAGMFWTVDTLGELLEIHYGVSYRSVRSLHAVLEESGLSYQRPEGVYRPRPIDAVIADFEADAEKNHRLQARPPRRADFEYGSDEFVPASHHPPRLASHRSASPPSN